ncbi:hypothetical protein RI054_16g76190 [Pseudoscourfieldia marina]
MYSPYDPRISELAGILVWFKNWKDTSKAVEFLTVECWTDMQYLILGSVVMCLTHLDENEWRTISLRRITNQDVAENHFNNCRYGSSAGGGSAPTTMQADASAVVANAIRVASQESSRRGNCERSEVSLVDPLPPPPPPL